MRHDLMPGQERMRDVPTVAVARTSFMLVVTTNEQSEPRAVWASIVIITFIMNNWLGGCFKTAHGDYQRHLS